MQFAADMLVPACVSQEAIGNMAANNMLVYGFNGSVFILLDMSLST